MDQSKIVGLALGNVSIPKENLTLASKVEIFLGACEIFQKSSEDMLSHEFTAWHENNPWHQGYAGNYLFFELGDKPKLDWLNEKTKVCVFTAKDGHRLDGTLLCMTSKGLPFFFSFVSKWRNRECTARTVERWEARQADEESLSDFFKERESLFNDALKGLVLISQQAVVSREHRLESSKKTRDQLLRTATMVTGYNLGQNANGWYFS